MASYCDLNAMKSDDVNHPYFTARLKNWTSGSGSGCTASTKSVKDLSGNDCLTDAEISCYSSYTLGSAREKLDNSLVSIYQPENSRSATFDSNYQMTMLTGVVWAALGTTVLYYGFTKI